MVCQIKDGVVDEVRVQHLVIVIVDIDQAVVSHQSWLELVRGARVKAAKTIGGEDHEVRSMYPRFAKEAEEEGETRIDAFSQVSKIEAHHLERYKKLQAMVEAGTVYKREKLIKWKCTMWGYVAEDTSPPQVCPSCEHPRKFYEPANLDVY